MRIFVCLGGGSLSRKKSEKDISKGFLKEDHEERRHLISFEKAFK